MKYINGKRPQSGRDRGGRSKVLQSGPHNRLRLAAANKAAKVKWLKAVKRQPNNGTYNNKLAKQNSRVTVNNVFDARVKLMQKALETPTVVIDARQKLTKQKDARQNIQERRLNSLSYNNTRNMGNSRGHSNNIGRVKIDRRGILTINSILEERATSHHTSVRDRQPTVNQGRFNGVERRHTSNAFNKLNTFRNDRYNLGRVKIDRRGILKERASLHHTSVRDRQSTVNQGRFSGVERRHTSNAFNKLNTFRNDRHNLGRVKIDRRGILEERASSHHTSLRDRQPTVNQGRFSGVERRHSSHAFNELNTFRNDRHNLGRLKIDRRGILTVNSILEEKASSHHTSVHDRRPTVNQGRFEGIEKRYSSNTLDKLNTFRSHGHNLGRLKIDRRGILTVKSILDEKASSHHTSVRDRQLTVNQGRFDGVERRHSSNTLDELNTFRSDRLIEDIRPLRRDMRISRSPITNLHSMRHPSERSTRSSRRNEKPYSRPMAMDYKNSMDLEETNRYSQSLVMSHNVSGNSMFNRDGYEDDLIDRNHGGLSETFRSRLDSHRAVVTKCSRPADHKIVISNLEPSVTSEDIRVMNPNVSGNFMFNRDGYEDDLIDRNSRNHGGLSETFRSRLDSHRAVVTKRSRPAGHKIVISNLEPSVTSEDIGELFADIGNLLESRMVRPGVAEVIYERCADAIEAIEVYHKRQLDGRPMKCDMVRNAVASPAGSISLPGSCCRINSRGTDMYKPSAYVTYDIDAVHTALFNK